jgi:hypothetical protein
MIVPPRVSRKSVILPHAVEEEPMAVICGTRPPLRCVRAVATMIPAIALLACDPRTSEQKPELVYLRTDSVTVEVTVRAESTVAVGDWLRLNASRSTSDGWRKVAFEEVPPGTPWIGYIPPAHEIEVAANLRWFAEPMAGVEFDAWAPRPVSLLERAVRFSRPGRYRLWATSHAPLDATSDTLHVEVRAR